MVLGHDEEQRHVGVADQADACRLHGDALRGLIGPQHVLPNRVPWRGVIERHRASFVHRLQPAQELDRLGLGRLAGPADGGRRGGREG